MSSLKGAVEKIEAPETGVLVRWRRTLGPGAYPIYHLDIKAHEVDVWQQSNPRDAYGSGCTRWEFLHGELKDAVLEDLGEGVYEEALGWLKENP